MGEICKACGHSVKLDALKICPACGAYLPLTPEERIALIADEGSFFEMEKAMQSVNPISLAGYEQKLEESRRRSSLTDAVTIGCCTIEGEPAIVAVMSFAFMGGSMGSVVGEKITQALLEGALTGRPVIIFTASGGARMQEGIFSLRQMAKTASAAALLEETGTALFIVLTDPTTGGVTASFAMQGDIIIAEPGALICFTGPRVIEQTIRKKLPEGFQRAEFQLERGFLDDIVDRRGQRDYIIKILRMHTRGGVAV